MYLGGDYATLAQNSIWELLKYYLEVGTAIEQHVAGQRGETAPAEVDRIPDPLRRPLSSKDRRTKARSP